MEPFICVLCQRVCSNIDFMRTHMSMHGYIYSCDACEYVFNRKEKFEKHVRTCGHSKAQDYLRQLKKKRKIECVDENRVVNCENPFLKQDYSIWDFGFML